MQGIWDGVFKKEELVRLKWVVQKKRINFLV